MWKPLFSGWQQTALFKIHTVLWEDSESTVNSSQIISFCRTTVMACLSDYCNTKHCLDPALASHKNCLFCGRKESLCVHQQKNPESLNLTLQLLHRRRISHTDHKPVIQREAGHFMWLCTILPAGTDTTTVTPITFPPQSLHAPSTELRLFKGPFNGLLPAACEWG